MGEGRWKGLGEGLGEGLGGQEAQGQGYLGCLWRHPHLHGDPRSALGRDSLQAGRGQEGEDDTAQAQGRLGVGAVRAPPQAPRKGLLVLPTRWGGRVRTRPAGPSLNPACDPGKLKPNTSKPPAGGG